MINIHTCFGEGDIVQLENQIELLILVQLDYVHSPRDENRFISRMTVDALNKFLKLIRD